MVIVNHNKYGKNYNMDKGQSAGKEPKFVID